MPFTNLYRTLAICVVLGSFIHADFAVGQISDRVVAPWESAGRIPLLFSPQIQGDLQLSESQLQIVGQLQRNFFAGSLPRVNLLQMTPEQREAHLERLAEQAEQRQAMEQQHLANVLTKGQIERLEQLHLQSLGAPAILVSQLPDGMELSASQREQVQQTLTENALATSAMLLQPGIAKDAQAISDQAARLWQASNAQVLTILNEQQRAAFQQSLGKPIGSVWQEAATPGKAEPAATPAETPAETPATAESSTAVETPLLKGPTYIGKSATQ